MAQTIKITVSGTVGKLALANARQGRLVGYSLVASGAARMKIVHGANSSGELVWEDRSVTSAGKTYTFPEGGDLHFSRGMHVTVIGTGATAYLLIA